MNKIILFLLCSVVLFVNSINAQIDIPNKEIDGIYHLLFEEHGIKTKYIQLAEKNSAKTLLVASCEECFPAMYQYRSDESESMEQSVFYAMGIFIIRYDAESFIAVVPSIYENRAFEFSNFYTKNKAILKTMTKEKIEAYASKL